MTGSAALGETDDTAQPRPSRWFLAGAVDWAFASPSNSDGEALTPNVEVGSWGGNQVMKEISTLTGRGQSASSLIPGGD